MEWCTGHRRQQSRATPLISKTEQVFRNFTPIEPTTTHCFLRNNFTKSIVPQNYNSKPKYGRNIQMASKTPQNLRVPALLIILLVCGIVGFSFSHLASAAKVRLYTHNIRYDNRNPDAGEPYWEVRQPKVAKSIQFHTQPGPAVVCLQEVLHNQLTDLLSALNKDEKWSYYGVGREDGATGGEFAPILFKDAHWTLVRAETSWLSPTPERPSTGWDAALPRIVTEVVLRLKTSKKRIKVMNTHFDHAGVVARRKLAEMIAKKMSLGLEPAFLCGDFNTEPSAEPYQVLNGTGFKDSRVQGEGYGYLSTFSGFDRETEQNTIIDYIWAGDHATFKDYGVESNHFDFYMSDHRPVIADYSI